MTMCWALATIKSEYKQPITRVTAAQTSAERLHKCSSRQDKMTIGTRLQSTIKRFFSWRNKKVRHGKLKTRPICVNFWKTRYISSIEIARLRWKMIGGSWQISIREMMWLSRKNWKSLEKRDATFKISIKSEHNSSSI